MASNPPSDQGIFWHQGIPLDPQLFDHSNDRSSVTGTRAYKTSLPAHPPEPQSWGTRSPSPSPPPMPQGPTDITIDETTFDYEDQKFIIQSMCFFNYTAEKVAPCLGLLLDGTLQKAPKTIEAAKRFFESDEGLRMDPSLWERDDARFKFLVDENIKTAVDEQNKRRAVREKTIRKSIKERLKRAIEIHDTMSALMEEEQQWFKRHWQRSEGSCDGEIVVEAREPHEMVVGDIDVLKAAGIFPMPSADEPQTINPEDLESVHGGFVL